MIRPRNPLAHEWLVSEIYLDADGEITREGHLISRLTPPKFVMEFWLKSDLDDEIGHSEPIWEDEPPADPLEVAALLARAARVIGESLADED